MIENVANLRSLAGTGDADVLSMPVEVAVGKDTLTAPYAALHVRRGHLLIWNEAALPIVGNKTSVAQFMDLQLQKFPGLLNRPLQPTAALSGALFVGSNQNYFHFLANYFPMFAFLPRVATPAGCAVAQRNGVPASILDTLREVLPTIASGRPVTLATLEPGVYAVEDVIFPTIAAVEFACVAVRRWLLPFVLQKHGLTDPARERGAVKIFIRREGANTGRNLVNQDEIEAWFVARGYTAVNPGALAFEEQVLLFARASHIAGVEGAAFTNLLFAINARQILMIKSPMLRSERNMANLVKRCHATFHTLYGNVVSDHSAGRNGDYHLPVAALTKVDPAVFGA